MRSMALRAATPKVIRSAMSGMTWTQRLTTGLRNERRVSHCRQRGHNLAAGLMTSAQKGQVRLVSAFILSGGEEHAPWAHSVESDITSSVGRDLYANVMDKVAASEGDLSESNPESVFTMRFDHERPADIRMTGIQQFAVCIQKCYLQFMHAPRVITSI